MDHSEWRSRKNVLLDLMSQTNVHVDAINRRNSDTLEGQSLKDIRVHADSLRTMGAIISEWCNDTLNADENGESE